MLILLALLPLLLFVCVFIYLSDRNPEDPQRRIMLHSAIWLGCYLAFSLEVLSLFSGITTLGLALTWLLPGMVVTGWLWRKKGTGAKIKLPARFHLPSSWWNRFLLLLIGVVLTVTAMVAWITPPQTWDSLTYHFSRVAHWAQNQSIWHYATGIDRQTSMPPGAEEWVLNNYMLTQSDRLSNFPQWFAMLGSLLGVSLVAYYLGANSSGQWLAAAFAATIPMGIVEASSTINDYMATFWVVCAVVECVAYYKNHQNRSLVYASLAAGLAIFTKPVAVPFLIPFALWLAFMLVRRQGWLTLAKWAGIAVLLVGVLNAGYLTRNVITYGALSNPVDFETHYNQLHTIPGLITTVLKNVGMQVGLPGLEKVNHAWFVLILKVVNKLGVDINDPRITAVGYFNVSAPSTHEDGASNPYHAYLIFLVFIALFFLVKKTGRSWLVYGLLAASTFLLFSLIYKWNAFGTRYDLAFFVLFAPLAGMVLEQLDKYKIGYAISALLFIGSFPWLFGINSRPLVSQLGYGATQGSILQSTRQDLYFANAQSERGVYNEITQAIKNQGCTQVGLMLQGDDPEYLIWELMGAPREKVTIEWIIRGPTDRYSPAGFTPCAIICRGCSIDQTPLRGLEIAIQRGDTWLYLPPASGQ
jgi:hypothetical protein